VKHLNFTLKQKSILILVAVTLAFVLVIGVIAAVSTPTQKQTITNVPDGQPTPTPTPVPTITPTIAPTPTPTIAPTPTQEPLTDTFTVTATINGTEQPNPELTTIPGGAYIGTVYVETFIFTSTANQPITVTASCPSGWTGNEIITWDQTTLDHGFTVSLPTAGSTATMTMTITLGSVGGSIPLVFTATP
jgi:hypothetical protein